MLDFKVAGAGVVGVGVGVVVAVTGETAVPPHPTASSNNKTKGTTRNFGSVQGFGKLLCIRNL